MARFYKRKCDACKNYFLMDEMVGGFGNYKCRDCSHKKFISRGNAINLSADLMKEHGLKQGSKVLLVNVEEGILIKKIKEE